MAHSDELRKRVGALLEKRGITKSVAYFALTKAMEEYVASEDEGDEPVMAKLEKRWSRKYDKHVKKQAAARKAERAAAGRGS